MFEQNFKIKSLYADQALTNFQDIKTRLHSIDLSDNSQLSQLQRQINELQSSLGKYKSRIDSYQCLGNQESALMDLLLIIEVATLQMYSQQIDQFGKIQNDQLSLVSKLLDKIDDIILREQFVLDSNTISFNLVNLHESNLIENLQEFIKTALINYKIIKEEQNPQQQLIFQQIESIFLKLSTAPVATYDNITNEVFAQILSNTDEEYHLNLITMIFDMQTAIWQQKKNGSAENFKSQIIFKAGYLVYLMLVLCEYDVKRAILLKIKELIIADEFDQVYIIYSTLNTKALAQILPKNKECEKVLLEIFNQLIIKCLRFMIDKEVKLFAKHLSNFVMRLKPLSETVKIIKPDNPLLNEKWKKDVKDSLRRLQDLFLNEKESYPNPPYNLIQVFFELNIMISQDSKGFISIQEYDTLLQVTRKLIEKADQNALIIVKLIQQLNKINMSIQNPHEFYDNFGYLLQKVLLIKDVNIFYQVLSAFVEFAQVCEIESLDNMIPEEIQIRSVLSQFITQFKFLLDDFNLEEGLDHMNLEFMRKAIKDADQMEKLCVPQEKMDNIARRSSKPHNQFNQMTSSQNIDQRKLAIIKKILDVELMIRFEDREFTAMQISTFANSILKDFTVQNPTGTDIELKRFYGTPKSAKGGFLSQVQDQNKGLTKGKKKDGVQSDSFFGTPGSVYYGLSGMAHELIKPEQYPDIYHKGGIQNGTYMNKLIPFVKNEQPLLRNDVPRLNLKEVTFQQQFQGRAYEPHMKEVDSTSFGFPRTSQEDPKSMNGKIKPKSKNLEEIPQTVSSFVTTNMNLLGVSKPNYARMISKVLPHHNPHMTAANNFQPITKPFHDKVVNPLYAQEINLPKLRSDWQFGHEVESCCMCNNPFQKFNYHRTKEEIFTSPDGTFRNHPAFHCEHNSACLCHNHQQNQLPTRISGQGPDPFEATEYLKMYSSNMGDTRTEGIITKSRSHNKLGPQFNFTLEQLNHLTHRGGPDRGQSRGNSNKVPYHEQVDYGNRAWATRVVPSSQQNRVNTNRTPFASRYTQYMESTIHPHASQKYFHNSLSKSVQNLPSSQIQGNSRQVPIMDHTHKYRQVNSIGNENFYKVDKNSVVISLFGELVIRYDLKSMTLEKFALLSITQSLSAYDSSYAQIDMSKIFICGGLRRGTSKFLSDFTAIFDCQQNEMFLFTPMQIPRHKHGVATLGNYVYAIGGEVADKAYSNIVERFNFNSKGWEYVAPLIYERSFSKVCVSTNSNKIFVFGGCMSNDHNSIIEVYDCHDNQWSLLGISTGEQPLILKEPFNCNKSFVVMVEGNLNTLIQPLDKDDRPLFNDFDDKILIITYDNLRFPAPSIFVVNIEKESLGEVVYDKEGSDQASNSKRLVVYDEVGEHIVAFAQLNFKEFDFLSFTNPPYRWRKSLFF